MRFLRHVAHNLMRLLPGAKAAKLGQHWRDLERLTDTDVAIVSFPKSGRTFVRVMLAQLYRQQFGLDDREPLKFANLRTAPPEVPRVLFTHNGDAMRRPAEIGINRKAFRGRKVVVLARHPGDVIVSRYFHLKHRSHDPARQKLAAQPLESFGWTPRGGIPSIVHFLNLWSTLADERGDILLLRYEDFLTEPEATLRRLAAFIGLASDDASIHDAVEFARFENLKQKERDGYFSSGRLGPGRAGNESSFKVRSGKSGGYRSQFSEQGQARIEAYVRDHLDPVFGYGGQARPDSVPAAPPLEPLRHNVPLA